MTTVKTSTIIAPIPPRTRQKSNSLADTTIIFHNLCQLNIVKNYLTLDNTLRNVDNTLIGRPPECQAQITQILHVRTVNKDVSKRKQRFAACGQTVLPCRSHQRKRLRRRSSLG